MVYLDNAATSGVKPKAVITAVNNALKRLSVNPGRGGYGRSIYAAETVFDARGRIAKLFNCESPERVIFTSSCTAAVNMVLKGAVKKGGTIVISSLEHNAVVRPAATLNRLGHPLKVAEVILGDAEATYRSFERAITEDVGMVMCTHASNVTGEILPIEAIGGLCKSRGVPFAVDAAQTAGVLNVDMQKMNIDYLCIAPHKGLYAPMGIGVLIARSDIERPLIEGGTGINSLSAEQPCAYPERLESGTLNLPGICGVSAGADFVNSYGINQIYQKEIALSKSVYNGLKRLGGITLYSPPPEIGKTVPIVLFNLYGKSSAEVADYLDKRGVEVRAGLHCAPFAHRRIGTVDSGAVRISPCIFNKGQEITYFLDCIKAL